ncbi:MAG: hypothetical protein RR574_04785 [Comamonas sp.]
MSHTPALRIYAGPKALAHIRQNGLAPDSIRVIPAAAGGPKGLILGPLDRFIFGQWLPQSSQTVDLVGASIGAWRMATACLEQPAAALERLERDYIAQRFDPPPGQKRTPSWLVSERFAQSLQDFYGGRVSEVLTHPRYRLHVIAARGHKLLARESRWRHKPSHYLDSMVVLAPDAAWVAGLPRGKLPDRHDFLDYGSDHQARSRAWNAATAASQQLADEFAQWLDRPDPGRVQPL